MKRVVLFVLLAFGPALLTSLIGCEGNCRGYSYRIANYQINLIRNEKTPPDESTTSRVSANDTVPYHKLELKLEAKSVLVSQASGGGSSLLACDPINIPLDKLKAITITSDKPYKAGLAAGTDLAPFTYIFSNDISTPQSVTNYVATASRPAGQIIILQLQEAPDRIARHRFTVTIELDNGKRITALSEPVIVAP